jgi:hypothetical protein
MPDLGFLHHTPMQAGGGMAAQAGQEDSSRGVSNFALDVSYDPIV